jgi:four helix bundle protein
MGDAPRVLPFAKRVRDWEVFRRAYTLSVELHKLSLGWDRREQFGGVADQLRRASKSICANMAEGVGKASGSKAEFRRFVLIGKGSANEVLLWLEYARDLGYMDERDYRRSYGEYEEVLSMLGGLAKKLQTAGAKA